jgi:glycosyltransferase involved in cell wall biosynthesis
VSALRCAYLVSRYPAVTHTFIQSEIQSLRARGVAIETMSVRPASPDEVLSPDDAEEHAATFSLVPIAPGRLIGAHLRAVRRSPRAYLQTLGRALGLANGSPRSVLWQSFYFAEAIVAHERMRDHGVFHLHVHFANVAADVALLATTYGNLAGGPRWSWSLTIHGPTELLDLEAHKLRAKVAAASAVICTSDFARSQVLACLDGASGAHVVTVRCGIDTERFHPPEGRARREELQILNVAGMSRRKGQIELVEAIAQARERGMAVRMRIAGDGPERPALERAVARLGVEDAVEFLGAVGSHAMPSLYRDADLFCLASFAEGVPTVLMEAMASGLPVISTNVMGTPELVEDGVSGILVPPARADLLADAIVRLAGDGDLRERMGAAARERVLESYELGAAADRLLERLEPIAER